MSIKSAVAQAVGEAFVAERVQANLLIQKQLTAGESLIGFQVAEKSTPFLLNVLPFVRQVLDRTKHVVLVVTDRRLLIIEKLQSFLTKKTQGTRLLAAIPLDDLESVTPSTGLLTGSVTIRTKGGLTFRYIDLLKSAASQLTEDVDVARRATGNVGSTTETTIVNTSPRLGVRLACLIVGALMIFASIGGFSDGNSVGASVVLLLGAALASAFWLLKPKTVVGRGST